MEEARLKSNSSGLGGSGWRGPPGNSCSYLKSLMMIKVRLGSKSFWARRIWLVLTSCYHLKSFRIAEVKLGSNLT
jgi:hypothetical protein